MPRVPGPRCRWRGGRWRTASRGGIEPVQFALAGMNAHINHDLPVAMVSTCAALGTSPEDPHLADYQKVDQLLDAAEQSIRQSSNPPLNWPPTGISAQWPP